MKGTHSDQHNSPPGTDSGDTAETGDQKQQETRREGPPRVSHDLDRHGKWDDASRHKGYQPGNQGGYKGDYDQGKYENRDFGFPDKNEDAGKADAIKPAVHQDGKRGKAGR
jgi:hypothetical protein